MDEENNFLEERSLIALVVRTSPTYAYPHPSVSPNDMI